MSNSESATININVNTGNPSTSPNQKSVYPWPILGPWIPICFPEMFPIFFKGQNSGLLESTAIDSSALQKIVSLNEDEIGERIQKAQTKEEIHKLLAPAYKLYPNLKKEMEAAFQEHEPNGTNGTGTQVMGLFWIGFILGVATTLAIVYVAKKISEG
jgi:hypothetical protein